MLDESFIFCMNAVLDIAEMLLTSTFWAACFAELLECPRSAFMGWRAIARCWCEAAWGISRIAMSGGHKY